MDPVEEVAYRNRPPLLEDVSIRGPLRVPVTDAMETLEEREAIEADFRWYRWSKFALPWLIWILAISTVVLCLSFWQQVGGLKHFPGETVFNKYPFPMGVPWAVPRYLVSRSETSSTKEAGMPKDLRNVRIAVVFHGALAIFLIFFTLLVKPRPRIRTALNWLYLILLLATCALAIVAFVIAIGERKNAVQCPWRKDISHEKCTVRMGFVTIPIICDAAIFLGAGISTILLAFFNYTGDWKLFRTGYRERERDAETEIIRSTEGVDKSLRKVRPVRITVLSLALLWTLMAIIVLTIFIILVHLDYQHEHFVSDYKMGSRGKNVHERSGWAARNTRLRWGASAIAILTVLLNLIPFTHRAIAYLFGILYFVSMMCIFVCFGLDISELMRAHKLQCPSDYKCRNSAFIATVIMEMFMGLSLLFYILYEYIAKGMTTSRWSGRNYCPHEIHKHDTKLDSMRPVRCEITGQVMTAKEYVYRYRFIAGTNPYYDQPAMLPVQPMVPLMAPPAPFPIEYAPPFAPPPAYPYGFNSLV